MTPRPSTLDGLELRTIELNFKNVRPFMDRLLERLGSDFRLERVERHPKLKFTEGYPPEALAEIGARANAVITAFGH